MTLGTIDVKYYPQQTLAGTEVFISTNARTRALGIAGQRGTVVDETGDRIKVALTRTKDEKFPYFYTEVRREDLI